MKKSTLLWANTYTKGDNMAKRLSLMVCALKGNLSSYEQQFASLKQSFVYFDSLQELSNALNDSKNNIIFFDMDDFHSELKELKKTIRQIESIDCSASLIALASENKIEEISSLKSPTFDFVIKKPINNAEVELVLRSIKAMRKKFQVEAQLSANMEDLSSKLEAWGFVDNLTHCYNHRYFSKKIQDEASRINREGGSVAEIVFDIDAFSSVNEIYGHGIGDIVITQFAAMLKDSVRSHDVVCRTGGQEFSVLLHNIPDESVEGFAQRIVNSVEKTHFGTEKEYLRISVSAGVAIYPSEGVKSTIDLVKKATAALRKAKKEHGSMVIMHGAKAKENKEKIDPEELQHQIADLNHMVNQGVVEMVYGFARLIEAKDEYTGEHVEDTEELAEKVARELKLGDNEIVNVKHAAILHDLGKVGIDESILCKEGSLSAEEFEEIQKHPVIAAEVLKSIHALSDALPAILHHHERFDGKGYPSHLKGEEIPLSARIVSIADVYQALTSDRPYRKAYTKEKALRIITEESGKQFDPMVVNAFLKVVK